MALRLNPAPPEPRTHEPSSKVFPKLDCPTFYVPIDRVREIAVILSKAPAEAIDCLDIVLAAPPALPFDIPTPLSAPPALPFNIPTPLAAPPAEPFDIQNPPSAPPALPFDIITPLSRPPADPVDIPNPPSAPPAEGPEMTPGPSQYGDNPNDPTVNPRGGRAISPLKIEDPRIPVGTDIRRQPPEGFPDTTPIQLKDIIYTDENGQRGHPETQELRFPGGYLDPRDDINLQANILGLKGVFEAAAKDLVDPFRLIRLGIQLKTDGFGALKSHILSTKIERANPFTIKHEDYIDRVDSKYNISTYQTELGLSSIERNNLYTPKAPYNNAHEAWGSGEARATFDLKELNDASTSKDNNAAFATKMAVITTPREAKNRLPKKILKQGTYFGTGRRPAGQIPASFENDGEDGSIITKNPSQYPHDIISDSEAYVPLSFTDLRPIGDGSQRTVYFRPFITSLTEDFSPEWDKKTLYGRSDQVVTYMSTVRTIFIGFELHAFYPDDLEMMYKKLGWLSSMVYPEYDKELLLKSGPVCRMRVGDVISGNNKQGLSGIIDSLSFDYTDSIWEIDDGRKAPRSIKVSVSFHALHEAPIGRNVSGDFGGLSTTPSTFRKSRVPGSNHDWESSTVVTERIEHDLTAGNSFFRGIGKLSK